ncbi:glycosyltransferase family 2 protein [uncultured Treponema sp.]|uniref:glycosyltransferase family 2 protein n=1 Tax=uncultured Treponema sp. TaxID=162155 RepID=UPI0025887E87|nr:glycosyltransferase family 2 protein [uncultured Treponema sp.]
MLLTICTAFYNVENYIENFILQLKEQTNPDFLCILVDDGSTDKSAEIAFKEIENDNRFSIIQHKTNKGIGAARTIGIENAKTDYITFIDSDDEIDKDTIEKILYYIQKQKADLYVFDYFEKRNSINKRITGNVKEISTLFTDSDKRISYVWHKVFSKKLLSKIDLNFFKTITFAEDLFLCINSFLLAENIIFCNDAYYHYVFNSLSLVHSRTEKSIYENILVVQNLINNNFDNHKYIKAYLEKEFFHSCGLLIFPNKNNIFQSSKPHFSEWRLKNKEHKIILPTNISIFVRIYIFLIKKQFDYIALLFWKILKIKDSHR